MCIRDSNSSLRPRFSGRSPACRDPKVAFIASPTFSNWINFNGNDGVIAIPTNNNVTYSDTDQITVEAWVRVNNGPTTSSANPQLEADFIISRQDDWQVYVEYLNGQLYFSGRIRQHYVGSWPKVSSSAINEGTWYHVAMTANSASSSGQLKLYINGLLVLSLIHI